MTALPLRGDLTEWHVEGVAECPRCCMYFGIDGTPQDLQTFITAHDCARERDDRD